MPAAGNESVDLRSNSREHNEQKNGAEEESFGSEGFRDQRKIGSYARTWKELFVALISM
jgi:hypothetical protein